MAEGAAITAIERPDTPGWSWPVWVRDVAQLARREGWPLRDVVVLLPHLHLLEAARSAWARHGAASWMPRIETTATLAASLGPDVPPPPGAVQGDTTLDRMTAGRLLGAAATSSPALAARVPALVDAAQALAIGLACQPPAGRAAWLAQARALVVSMAAATDGGPGAQEAALLRLALEWAAQYPRVAGDMLFALRPAAFIVLLAAGLDALSAALVGAARANGVPVQVMDLDAPALESADGGPALGWAALGAVPEPAAVALCSGPEDEARRCAHALAEALASAPRGAEAQAMPGEVALIAEDRLLVRRVRALLETRGIAIDDETGWKLATTRAAAALMALLRAARPAARSDDMLDALKACAEARAGAAGATAVAAQAFTAGLAALPRLEALLRRHGWRRATAALPPGGDAAVQGLWQAWQAVLVPLGALERGGPVPLALALQRLQGALLGCGLWPVLQGDAAGAQLIDALQFERAGRAGAAQADDDAWSQALRNHDVDLQGLIDWVDGVLEERRFQPPATPTAPGAAARAPRVVITPLARALLRPWHAVVFPGLDERHFGAQAGAPGLISDGLALALGLPGAADRRRNEWLALRLLVRSAPRCVLLRRSAEDGEPLAASPWLERLAARLAAHGRPLRALPDTRARLVVHSASVPAAAPVWHAAALRPAVLSARACELLRSCPYRFHVREALGLREADELDDTLRAADIGDWLHRALQAFHQERAERGPRGAEADAQRLSEMARALLEDPRWNALDFLPDALDLPRLSAAYVQWLMQQEAAHWQVGPMEHTLRATVGALAGSAAAAPADAALAAVRLEGRVDRLDHRGSVEAALRVVDYKTRSAEELKKDVAQPQEDTQLAFYAALARAAAGAPGQAAATIEAGYLALRKGEVTWIAHREVERTAQGLMVQLVHDLRRLHAGHPLYALGEPPACDHCEARGLCRRDHRTTRAVAQ